MKTLEKILKASTILVTTFTMGYIVYKIKEKKEYIEDKYDVPLFI